MIEGRASITAHRVAALRVGFEREPAEYATSSADDRLSTDVAGDVETATTSPRMVEYLRARTRFFDRAVVGAIADGVTQIVVGAAGYDARSLRYRASGVAWFEVDHPDTQRDKRERLARLGIETGWVRFVAADFVHDDVGGRLIDAGFDPRAPTLFMLEGVIAYLDRHVVTSVLASFAAVAHGASRLVASFSTTSAGSAAAREQFRRGVASVGEPASTPTTIADLSDSLAAVGWQRSQQSERAVRAGFIEFVRDTRI